MFISRQNFKQINELCHLIYYVTETQQYVQYWKLNVLENKTYYYYYYYYSGVIFIIHVLSKLIKY
jgi:hypothetical protein